MSSTEVDQGGLTYIVKDIKIGATGPGQEASATSLSSTELGFLDGITAGTVSASKAVVVDSSKAVTGINGVTSIVTGVVATFVPTAVQQALSGAGAVNLTSYNTAVTTTGANALTLADSTVVGQVKRVQMIVDGGDGTLTFNTNATITFADAGDTAELIWTGTAWSPIALYNLADGATAPAYSAAS